MIEGLTFALQPWRERARAAWRARSPRDRAALLTMALVLGAFLIWQLLVAPALNTLRSAPMQLEALDTELQQMRGMSNEVRELRNIAAIASAQTGAAIRAAVERHGDKVRMSMQADRAVLTLQGASPEQLRALLVETRNAARARPLEAQLTRGPSGFSGTLVLGMGGN